MYQSLVKWFIFNPLWQWQFYTVRKFESCIKLQCPFHCSQSGAVSWYSQQLPQREQHMNNSCGLGTTLPWTIFILQYTLRQQMSCVMLYTLWCGSFILSLLMTHLGYYVIWYMWWGGITLPQDICTKIKHINL